MMIAGLGDRYRFETVPGIPQLWRRFAEHFGNIPGQVGQKTYGVCCNADDGGSFDYIAAVEVDSFDDLPKDFRRLRIEPQRYAVFEHKENISSLHDTVHTIWNHALEEAGLTVANSPDFELYDDRFDPKTGNGGLEVWIPIKA
ncbi:MAG: GyrI-like domain-containing protein, partial [Pseudomonadota bacterium]